MNGLAPKSRTNGAKKLKNISGSPIFLETYTDEPENNSFIQRFISTKSVDEQLETIKSIYEEQRSSWDECILKFLAIVYYEAPAKHPVKCFLIRNITKCSSIEQQFAELLSAHILTQLSGEGQHFPVIVARLLTCIENFPAGAAALKIIDLQLANYLLDCFIYCFDHLRQSNVSPTKKNEIFTLEHSSLRILVHVIQKLIQLSSVENGSEWTVIFASLGCVIDQLMVDEDVPMDTKCLSGILYLSIELCASKETKPWMSILTARDDTLELIKHKAGQLAVYSAIITCVPMEELHQSVGEGNEPTILVIVNKLLEIVESSASEPALTLGVARSLLQVSKSLDSKAGASTVESLLTFVWPHLEYHLDSVRHLAQQILTAVLDFCARLDTHGNSAPLSSLVSRLQAMPSSRGFYWCVGRAGAALGPARVLRHICSVSRLLEAASTPHLYAAANSAIAALLPEAARAGPDTLFQVWVGPALRRAAGAALPALEALLKLAVKEQPELIPYMKEYMSREACSTRVSLAWCRAAGGRATLSHDVLTAAALDASDEIRILSLSLATESEKTTAPLSARQLRFVVWFLRYNINAASPSFRQLVLAHINKVLKRLEDSYRVMRRVSPTSGEHYIQFVEELRALCYASLVPGGNYGRRTTALQLLAAVEKLHLHGKPWIWKEEYVETLLLHLDDCYEKNKMFALLVLQHCPQELLEREYSTSLLVRDILLQASSLRPAASLSAAYKLRLVMSRLQRYIIAEDSTESDVTFYTLTTLSQQVGQQVATCEQQGVAAAARRAPMFGMLHCVAAVLRHHTREVVWEGKWSDLAVSLTELALRVIASVRDIVDAASPEGHLPGDEGVTEITLEDGRHVTAQMVLVCAWRSVKEASAVLGELLSQLPAEQFEPLIAKGGEHLLSLLSTAQHRGAVEQAAAGLTQLALRCWSCDKLCGLPRGWVTSQLRHVCSHAALPATRRGAGLPFLIQALVTSELQATGRGECFTSVMSTLLRLAAPPAPTPATPATPAPHGAERRAFCANVLRALFRHSALDGAVQPYIEEGLRVALCGFDADGWPERTAMCLLLSALCVRVFGVPRGPAHAALDVRNMMTGRVFFQRYPRIYDLMLHKLSRCSPRSPTPSPFPALLVLARLYPSALEGAVSNLKLAAFVPLVERCGHSGVLKTRQLAARALPPLVSPPLYVPQIEKMLRVVSSPQTASNSAHGVLLQLRGLLECPPASVRPRDVTCLRGVAVHSLCLLGQTCYVVVREYVGVLNLIVWRFPELIEEEMLSQISPRLEQIIFSDQKSTPSTGSDLCLADCLYFYLVLLHKDKNIKKLVDGVIKCLEHKCYEIVLSALNYLLVLHGVIDSEDCRFLEHLSQVCDGQVLKELRQSEEYVNMVSAGLHGGRYVECRHKCLTLLTLERDTQRCIVDDRNATDEQVITKLINLIDTCHDNLTHLYLESLLDFVTGNLQHPNLILNCMLQVLRTMFSLSSAENGDETRTVVVSYLERNVEAMMSMDLGELDESDKFEYKATIIAMLVTLLEDDDIIIRQRAADVTWRLSRDVTTVGDVTLHRHRLGAVVASLCGEVFRDTVEGMHDCVPFFVMLALLDFKSEVVMTDDINDECRVFDQSERYNIFLEESVWTCACADKIIKLHPHKHNLIELVLSTINDTKYTKALERLCQNNLVLFKEMASGEYDRKDETVNPKIELFIKKLSVQCK